MKTLTRCILLDRLDPPIGSIKFQKQSIKSVKEFQKVSDDPSPALACFENVVADGLSVLGGREGGKTDLSVNFCHPKTNSKNKISGLSSLNRFSKAFFFSVDFLIKHSVLVAPKFTKSFLIKAYRKLVYKFKILDGVDTLYIKTSKENHSINSAQTTVYFSASSDNFFLDK